jgi:DmsE family decaheme c-type cytochrome
MRSTDLRILSLLGLAAMFFVPARGEAARKFGGTYAGSETCQTCHEDIYNNVLKTPHGLVEKGTAAGPKGDWKEHACEACHGPGTQHTTSLSAADIRNPAKLPATQVDQVCLGCHRNQETHAGRIVDSHAKQGISCTSCHKVHADEGHSLVARTSPAINQQCASCHLSVMASFQKPYGHKITQNAMNCVDCHNPHGGAGKTAGQALLGKSSAANEPGCFSCHGDKRGPFTFDHAPVRLEGCGACHEPHGSTNPRMLARHEVRLVCLECHANLPGPSAKNAAMGVVPPAIHDLRSPRYQNCTVCHQKIHGSYTDGFLIR